MPTSMLFFTVSMGITTDLIKIAFTPSVSSCKIQVNDEI